ncbi:MAG: response regulator transcription factor [Mediterranea sp.]|jgi:DNA-binding NarL/FixJ family response regulator|nr:response regulator transcription factor [Mediterranea sp.]
METKNGIKILVVDDHELILHGVKRVLENSMPEVSCICTASSGKEVLALIHAERFDLFLLDIELPDISGITLILSIREANPDARIIVNTMHEERWVLKELLAADVDGILVKSRRSSTLIDAVKTVLTGQGKYYCKEVRRISSHIQHADKSTHGELSDRELDVLKCISEGKSTQGIAEELFISPNTVETHRRHLFEKLDVHNAVDLVMVAISRNLIPIVRNRDAWLQQP